MATAIPRTVGESLYWSYANLAMAFSSRRHGKHTYQQDDFIVRNKNYHGLLRGTLQLGSFLVDAKWKMHTSGACCYCGCAKDLTLDHLIPQFKGGKHYEDNLVVACRSCNSSKNALDLMEWMAKKGEFPSLGLLRRYLKLAIGYCTENGLMDVVLEPRETAGPKQMTLFDDVAMNNISERSEGARPAWPFTIGLIPHTFPNPNDLVWWVPSEARKRARAEWAAACGPELLAAEKQWRKCSESEGYILAIYQKGANTIIDVLRVDDAWIEGKRKKTLKLHVVAPKLKKDEFFGDCLEWERDFQLPIHKVLYSETLPPTFHDQGIPEYRQTIERGREIAKTLDSHTTLPNCGANHTA